MEPVNQRSDGPRYPAPFVTFGNKIVSPVMKRAPGESQASDKLIHHYKGNGPVRISHRIAKRNDCDGPGGLVHHVEERLEVVTVRSRKISGEQVRRQGQKQDRDADVIAH